MALQPRPPIVTIMGHVDHGKTTLLDTIRKAHVAAGEAGGITQHIGAYQAEYQGKKITFIDTPGHAAFSKMRSRGAQVTDLIILVVAADDGVKPQTVESIQHIQASNVPVIVAITKMDAVGASAESVKAQLTEHSVFVTGYGGDTEVVELSAKTGQGIDSLLETIVTMGELLELQADPEAEFTGVVIESQKHPHFGPMATVLVQSGTLRPRQTVYIEDRSASVRTLTDSSGKTVEQATPAQAVEVTGFSFVPDVGSRVASQSIEKIAANEFQNRSFAFGAVSGEDDTLRLILKADVAGTLEALKNSLVSDEITIITDGVGEVSESDVSLAETAKAVIVAFQVRVPGAQRKLAERLGVMVKKYDIIYELLEDVQDLAARRHELVKKEEILGTAEVVQTFMMRGQMVLGCTITLGTLHTNDRVRIERNGTSVGETKITSLKQGKTDMPSMSAPDSCGIGLEKTISATPGDILVAFRV